MNYFTLIAYRENAVETRRSCVVGRTDSAHEIFYSPDLNEIANRVVEIEAKDVREHRDSSLNKKFTWDRSSWEMTILHNGRPLGEIDDDFTIDQEAEATELESYYHQALQERRNHYVAECERVESLKRAEKQRFDEREKVRLASEQQRQEKALLKTLQDKYGT